jgi:hypothetical protein
MTPVIAYTMIDSSKTQRAGVEAGEKSDVGLIHHLSATTIPVIPALRGAASRRNSQKVTGNRDGRRGLR